MTSLLVTLTYTPRLAPDTCERAAFLTVFASKDVRASPYERVALRDTDAETRARLTLMLTLASADAMPRDASLSVCAFASTTNKHGEPALNQAGSARFYLKDVLRSGASGSAKKRMEVAAASNYYKGDVEVSVEARGFAARFAFAPATAYDYDGTPEQTAAFARAVDAHVEATRAVTQGLPPARGAEQMRQIHAPYYRGHGITMPGAYFALVRPDAPSPSAFYESLLDVVLRRHYPRLSPSEARAHLAARAPWRDVAVVLAKMLCLYPNYCTYLTDKVCTGYRRVGAGGLMSVFERAGDRYIESFDVTTRVTASADCEDMSLESAMESLDVLGLRSLSAALQRVVQCRRAMECTLNLMGVGGAQLGDSTAQLGGHMSARLTPRPLFLERFDRVSIVASESGGAAGGGVGVFGSAEPAEAFARELPILNLEGTGVLAPDVGEDSTGPLHAYLSEDSEAAFDRLKFSVEVPRSHAHVFYRYSQSEFLVDRAELGFKMLEAFSVQAARGQALSSAVPFPASRNERDATAALWAGPELSDALVRWAPHVLKHLHPVEPFEAPPKRAPRKNAMLERLVVGADRPVLASWRNIDYAVRDNQLGEQRVAALEVAFTQKRRVERVEYYEEPLTRTISQWLLRVWVN